MWLKLNPDQQSVLVLVYLRKATPSPTSRAASAVDLLARRAPTLRQAARVARRAGYGFVIVDGTFIPVDGVAADRPFCSGKYCIHGMNVYATAARPVGRRWADPGVLW